MSLATRPLSHNNKQKLVCKNESVSDDSSSQLISVSMKLNIEEDDEGYKRDESERPQSRD